MNVRVVTNAASKVSKYALVLLLAVLGAAIPFRVGAEDTLGAADFRGGIDWPKILDNPRKTKIGLGVHIYAPRAFLEPGSTEIIEQACAAFLREKLEAIRPDIEVLPMSELDVQPGTDSDPSIVRAVYFVSLRKWTDVRSGSHVVLGATELRLHLAIPGYKEPSFPLGLFQSEREQHALIGAIQAAIRDHIMTTIVAPIGATVSP